MLKLPIDFIDQTLFLGKYLKTKKTEKLKKLTIINFNLIKTQDDILRGKGIEDIEDNNENPETIAINFNIK